MYSRTKMKYHILVVEDEPSLRISLKKALEGRGYSVVCTTNIKEASQKINMAPDVMLVDLNLPDGKGTTLIETFQKKYPDLQSILITGETSIQAQIVGDISKGVFGFTQKPFEMPMLLHSVEKAIKQKQLLTQNKHLKANLQKQFSFEKIIGSSESILKTTELMKKVVKSPSTVLITGESGTGKELIARSIHCTSGAEAPFISVNCGAIPKDLMESEFFGHVKGAFTGAINERKGRFEMAQGGTLFLDEIGEMDLSLQVKLLRVLQEREFEPVGSCKPIPFNARIIAATNCNLEKAIEQKTFRKDLYFRLNIIPIPISPLRKRVEDVHPLLKHFIKKFNASLKSKILDVSADALECLENYEWPGNIREMENLIERISVLKEGEGDIQLKDLPERYQIARKKAAIERTISIPDQGMDFNECINNYENAILLKTLDRTGWNRRQAAQLLRLNRTTLVEKIKKKGLKPPDLTE